MRSITQALETTSNPLLRRRLDAMAMVHAVAIALSAFLLFVVEPMAGRILQPALGGAPAVWATVLAFFQFALLVGYAYAHVSVTRLGPVLGPALHVVLAAGALASLALTPAHIADFGFAGLPPVPQVVAILAVLVGLPAFVLGATTPLLSAWLSSALAVRGASMSPLENQADPYRLYVVSNAGSLLALIAYPLVIDPSAGLTVQRSVWSVGFGLLFLLIVVAAWVRIASRDEIARRTSVRVGVADDARVDRIPAARVARWLVLAAVPAGLLSAVTNFITTDLISAPLLWVCPLALYLGTFIVAFSTRGKVPVRLATSLAPAFVTLLWVAYGSAAVWAVLPLLALELGGFAIVALALHGKLAADRPSPAALTTYYLVLAAGGVVGGGFVGLVAPVVFPGIWEYPILLVVAAVGLALHVATTSVESVRSRGSGGSPHGLMPFFAGAGPRLLPYVLVGGLVVATLAGERSIGLEAGGRWLIVGGLLLLVGGKPWFFATGTALVLVLAVLVLPPAAIFQARDFFGVVEVLRPPGEAATILMHGTTVHGSQSSDPLARREPQGYYVRQGPLGDVIREVDARTSSRSIGIVGLGAGAISAYERPTDRMTFFEIDPEVIRVATDTRFFTYAADAPVTPSIVPGDGRLSLEATPSNTFDLLVLDAFSSDTIPTHLLTVEAIRDDLRVLRPGGFLLFHLSNRYYDLAPAVAAGVAAAGMHALERTYAPPAGVAGSPSRWLVAALDPAPLAGLSSIGWVKAEPAAEPLTDDHPDVLRFLQLGF